MWGLGHESCDMQTPRWTGTSTWCGCRATAHRCAWRCSWPPMQLCSRCGFPCQPMLVFFRSCQHALQSVLPSGGWFWHRMTAGQGWF